MAPQVIPKSVWFEDGKGYMRELSSETPARKEGKMFPLHEARPYDDIEVHDHSWVSGMVVDPPKEMVFEVRVMVPSHEKPKDVGDRIQRASLASPILSARVIHKEGA